jgi:hypothetical protein
MIPVDVYEPFTLRVRERLERYVDRVDKLTSMRFFNTSETLHVMGGAEGVRTEGLETFDEEALMATIPLFRMLYTGSEPTSFAATLNVLKRAVKSDASLRDQAIAELRTLGVAFENGKKTASFGMIVDWVARDGTTTSAERMDPEHLIDLWLHGYFLHGENEKSNELQRWPIEHVPLWELCGAIRRLTNIFRLGREVVAMALEADNISA